MRADPAGSPRRSQRGRAPRSAGEPHEVAARELRVELDARARPSAHASADCEDTCVDSGDRPRRTSGSAAGRRRTRTAVARRSRHGSAGSSLRPRFRIVSIIPGIETGPPERTDRSSGRRRRRSACPSMLEAREVLIDLLGETRGPRPSRIVRRHASVVIVKPRGTGSPSCVISARPSPLPPSSARPPVARLVEVVDESLAQLWLSAHDGAPFVSMACPGAHRARSVAHSRARVVADGRLRPRARSAERRHAPGMRRRTEQWCTGLSSRDSGRPPRAPRSRKAAGSSGNRSSTGMPELSPRRDAHPSVAPLIGSQRTPGTAPPPLPGA